MGNAVLSKVRLSVCLITYNHERYIAQCIESIFNQKADFDYEVVVADDCSTDNTVKIIKQYAPPQNVSVRFLTRTVNLGMVKNYLDAYEACEGYYIATIEGDDYWITTDKLQRQVNLLEQNESAAFCITDAVKFFEETRTFSHYYDTLQPPPPKFNIDYLILNNVSICHNTKVFKKSTIPNEFPPWFTEVTHFDYCMHIFNAERGDIVYLPEKTTCYRVHSSGILKSTKYADLLLRGLKLNADLNKYLKYKYNSFYGQKSWYYQELAAHFSAVGDVEKFFRYLFLMLANDPLSYQKWRDAFYFVKQFKKA